MANEHDSSITELGIYPQTLIKHHSLGVQDPILFPMLSTIDGAGLVDHSPHEPKAVPQMRTASRLVLVDNYDSFTWNGESS